MPLATICTYQHALSLAKGTKHLLLGNGFSRALRNDIFSYDALFEQADFTALPPAVRDAFGTLGTTDFESVMKSLWSAADLLALYAPDQTGLRDRLLADADGLRELLAATIAKNHPDKPGDIGDAAFESCRTFLSAFKNVYTLNYDLLLYWTLMHSDDSAVALKSDDGFRAPEDGEAEHVTWEVEKTDGQNIHYLHGALHIFDAGSEITKVTWVNTGVRLIEQIRDALEARMFPLIVAEGDSGQKMERIMHSNYLSRSYRSFSKISGNLFVFGHSMGPSDSHILRLIERGKVGTLWVGLYGDPESECNRRIIARVKAMEVARGTDKSLMPYFYDAGSAMPWGPTATA